MATSKSFRFEVLRLRGGSQTFDLSEPPATFDLLDDPEYLFEEPVRLQVTLRLIGTTVLMNGEISTLARAACARCLEKIGIPLRARVDLVWMNDERLLDLDRYPELYDDHTHYYDGEIVYPAEQLRELLLLELPTVPACELEPGDICPVRNVKVEPQVFGPEEEFEEEKMELEEEEGDSLAAQLKKLRRDMES